MPNAYQLTGGDGGSHTFTDIVLKTAGLKTVTVKDEDINISSTASINVIPASFSNETSSFTSTKSKLIVNKDKASLKATALDGYGNSLSDKEISISFNSSYGDLKVKIGKTGASGIGEFEFTPKKEGKVVFSAYNETDETAIGTPVTIEVLSDTIINNIAADISAGISSATNTITQGKEAAMSAAKAVSLLVEALQESESAAIVAKVAKNIVAATASLGLIPIIANIVGSAPAAIHVVNYGISLSLEALGVKKRRRSWGRVYDSTTGKGVDMALVRLFDQQSMKLVSTVVTDIKGRYSFQPEPGIYAVSVSKDSYIFPTAIFAQYKVGIINKDPSLTNKHYVGQPVSIESANNLINIDIPIDPRNKKPTTWIKVKVLLNDLFDSLTVGLSRLFFPVLVFGLVLSAFTAIVIPETKNLIISGIYTAISLIYVVSRAIKSSHYGIVYDSETKEPVSNAVVSIFDNEYGSLKETRISDKYGRFSILAQPGTYKLKAEKEGYFFPAKKTKKKSLLKDRKFKNPYTGGSFSLKSAGFIKYSVPMDKK